MVQFEPVFRLDVATLGPKDFLDMGLGALNHLNLEALGLLQLALLLCLDLLYPLPLDYLYLGAFETFCFVSASDLLDRNTVGVCCQENLFQFEAFDCFHLGGFGVFWHDDHFPASAGFDLGELLVFYHLVLTPVALKISYQLILVELGLLAYLCSVALERC